MAKVPTSYKDPFWQNLAAEAEKSVGLPQGLLSSIILKGERSNNDQVSEAGAKTVFQIIPETRRAVLKKYGVDAYASPQDAARASALLLKESLDRNKGNVGLAVAEYHGGTDRANWGPRTRAYVNRVVGQAPQQQEGETAFQRAMARQQPAQKPSIAAIYDAYKKGRMTPEEEQQFEADVNSGLVLLPRGASLAGKKALAPLEAPEPVTLPVELTYAYQSGKLNEQERVDLEADIRAGIVKLPPTPGMMVKDTDGIPFTPPTEQGIIEQAPEPSIGEEIVGAGEAGLTAVSGMAGAMLGAGSTLAVGIPSQLLQGTFATPEGRAQLEGNMSEIMEATTYQPRTDAGQRAARTMARVAQQLPVTPVMAEMGAIAPALQAARPAARQMAAAAKPVVQRAAAKAAPVVSAVKRPVVATADAVRAAPARLAAAVGMGEEAPAAPRGGSVGAAGTELPMMRQAMAEELDVPIQMTRGQATKDQTQLQFESNISKMEQGAPLRQRYSEQVQAIGQNLDAWIDKTGAQAPDARSVGMVIDKALETDIKSAKNKIRVAYKRAQDAGEMEEPVEVNRLADWMNENRARREQDSIMGKVQRQIDAMEIGEGSFEDGSLVLKRMTLGQAEEIRKLINEATDWTKPNEARVAGQIKDIIDAATESVGGQLYRTARALRQDFARKYENRAVIADITRMKGTSDDRKVAIEDIADRIIYKSSLDDLRHAGRVLKTTPEGRKAWREIQGRVIESIKEKAFTGPRDANGNPTMSAGALKKAIDALDKDGKLNYLFGNAGASKLRLLRDIAEYLFIHPPGSINTSNTATALAAMADWGLFGMTGVPAPAASGARFLMQHVKDKKLKARINDALNWKPKTENQE